MKSRKVLLGLIAGFCVCFAGTVTAQKANFQNNKLVEIGPDNIGGRVTSMVAMQKNDTRMYYAGAASGGLYSVKSLLATESEGVNGVWNYVPC